MRNRRSDGVIVLVLTLLLSVVLVAYVAESRTPPQVSDQVATYSPSHKPRPTYTRVAFIGDSYTAGSGSTAKDFGWSSLLSRSLDWSEKNFASGGTGYTSGSAKEQRPPYISKLTEVVEVQPEIVVISGGRNDAGIYRLQAELFTDAVEELLISTRESLPNAKIIVLSPSWDDDPVPDSFMHFAAALETTVEASEVDAYYVDFGYPLLGKTEMLIEDGVHPNDHGHQAMATAIRSALISNGLV